jgi:hypothetical protein
MQNKIIRFVIWICSKFTKIEIEQIIIELNKILSNQNPEVKPKDNFQQEHPNYRKFTVDPNTPFTDKPDKKK